MPTQEPVDPVTTLPQSGDATAAPATPHEPPRVLLHMPVDVRSVSLGVLAAMGGVFMLHWAREVFIPVLIALTFSYALAPLVNRLQRWYLPRALAASLVMLGLIAALGGTVYTLRDDAATFVEGLPEVAQKLRRTVRAHRSPRDSTIEKVQKAAATIEQAAKESVAGAAPVESGVRHIKVETAPFSLKDYLWARVPKLAEALGMTTVVLFLTFFLLVAGDTFRRKLVKLAGPTLARRRVTVEALDEINQQIQRYLLVQVAVSLVVGVATGLAFWAVGMEHAAVWGVMAAVLNLIPYLGSILLTAASALGAFVQFGTLDSALLLAGISLVIHTLTGHLLTPWLTSRSSRMNPVVVFVGVLFFGWLWGVWGLLLGVPVLMMVKAVCDRVEDLKPVGEMLGA